MIPHMKRDELTVTLAEHFSGVKTKQKRSEASENERRMLAMILAQSMSYQTSNTHYLTSIISGSCKALTFDVMMLNLL